MPRLLDPRRAILLACLFLLTTAFAAGKPHVIAFGKWIPVKLFVGPTQAKSVDLKVRTLTVDGRIKEFTTGDSHDVTDRMFAVRRAYRINDSLPEDEKAVPHWKWQRGGWLLVDRSTGHVGQISLPDFDPYYSIASWYRDYVAYCGISDDGDHLYAVVAQLGRKKALVRKDLGAAHGADLPDSECPEPNWQRGPMRVTFAPAGGQKVSFTVRGHSADIATTDEEDK